MTTLTADGYTTGTVNARGVKLTIKSKPADKTKERLQVVTKYMYNGRNLMSVAYKNGSYWVRDYNGRAVVRRDSVKDANAVARNYTLEMIDNAIKDRRL